MQSIPDNLKKPLVELLLSVADDKLMLGHRASDWTGLAPILEEDIAFSAISQEEIAHASVLYELAAPLTGQTPDALAFGRGPEAYRCAEIVELSDDFDWARAIARQFLCDRFDSLRLERLSASAWEPLAAMTAHIHAEESTHVQHGDTWMLHLGLGGEESKQRIQSALDAVSPYAGMLFEATEGLSALEEANVYPLGESDMFERWQASIREVLREAGLSCDVSPPAPDAVGGRQGKHGAGFGTLLDEMCEVYRVEPEAAW